MRRDSRETEDGMVGLRGTVQIGHHGTLLLRSLAALWWAATETRWEIANATSWDSATFYRHIRRDDAGLARYAQLGALGLKRSVSGLKKIQAPLHKFPFFKLQCLWNLANNSKPDSSEHDIWNGREFLLNHGAIIQLHLNFYLNAHLVRYVIHCSSPSTSSLFMMTKLCS